MDRRAEILQHIGIGKRGIEVAPWHSPIVPVGGDREVIALDVFDRPTLLASAEVDPGIDRAAIANIGEVDLVGSACDIAELAIARFGPDVQFDFVVSSHNFEHLPDPVRFLRGCEALLAPGGIVAMAIPDKRACFDFFRPQSGLAEILQAYHERRERPTYAQTFSQTAYHAGLRTENAVTGAFSINEDVNRITLLGDLVQAHATWRDRVAAADTQYYDTHCWTFTPSSLRLILTELVLLGLIDFEILAVSEPQGCEFFVHLRKRPAGLPPQQGVAEQRERLLKQIVDELRHPTGRIARQPGTVTRHEGAAWLVNDTEPTILRVMRGVRRRICRNLGI
jgi:SAM-dependent methyltransferase